MAFATPVMAYISSIYRFNYITLIIRVIVCFICPRLIPRGLVDNLLYYLHNVVLFTVLQCDIRKRNVAPPSWGYCELQFIIYDTWSTLCATFLFYARTSLTIICLLVIVSSRWKLEGLPSPFIPTDTLPACNCILWYSPPLKLKEVINSS